MNRPLCAAAVVLLLAPGLLRAADPLTLGGDPAVDPNDFRITEFAKGLNYPVSLEPLPDGSLLVATSRPAQGSFFNSTGELLRLVDADHDGVADGAPQVLYAGLPGGLTSMRRAGNLVFTTVVKAGYNGISVLRAGATPDAPLTMVGSLDFTYPENWDHVSFTLATRVSPGEPDRYDLAFNVGSQFNFSPTIEAAKMSGLANSELLGDSIYLTSVQDTGTSVEFGPFTQIARGLRNAAGIEFDPTSGALWFEDNGIDGLVTSGVAHSADELNLLPADQIGGVVEDYGFPHSYYEYGTGTFIGGQGEAAAVVFQPWPDPATGFKSEGPYEVALAPAGFPEGLNAGVFVGFHGNSGGPINDENPLVYADPQTGKYFHFVSNDQPNVGHLDGLKATNDSLFVADMSSTGSLGTGVGQGVIYQIKSLVSGLPGDVDGNLQVDLSDFGILKANFGATAGRRQGDLTLDGKIDLSDFGLLKANFGKSGTEAAVPEPSTFALSAAAVAGMFLRARRSTRGRKRRGASKDMCSIRLLEQLESRELLAADLVAVSPLDRATDVGVNDNLVLTFSDPVQAGPGAGRLLILNAADDSLVESIDVSDPARVQFNGATVTVDPVNPLPADSDLYIAIDPGAIRDLSASKAEAVLFSENFETTKLLDSPLDNPGLNNAAVFLTGTLDVTEAGEYRFLSRSDDGAYLVIDLNQDGETDYDDFAELVILDDTTHGLKDVFSDNTVPLEVGQYKFEYMYFNGGGGSAAELIYAPDPTGELFTFDAAKFAIVGDGSKGIGVTDELIKATTYAAVLDEGVTLGDIDTARSLRDEGADLVEGYPVSATIKTADVWSNGNKGYYPDTNVIPGQPAPPAGDQDYRDTLPAGWSKETNKPQTEPVYDGWTQLGKDFWIAEQGDQNRSGWELGQGTVLVMDPDAFADFADVPSDLHGLEAYATLPAIDLTDVTAHSVKLSFDSSFRPKSSGNTNAEHPEWLGQTALIDVSLDGGATWANVLVKNSETAGGDDSLAQTNEHLTVNIPNPVGGSLHVRFGLVNASDDWWWGVDNLVITGEAVGNLDEGIANDRAKWNFSTDTGSGESCFGGINEDGKVDLTDFGILKDNFGISPATLAQGDVNGDAKVDLTDFGLLKSCFGRVGMLAPAVASTSGVPAANRATDPSNGDLAFATLGVAFAELATDERYDQPWLLPRGRLQ